MFDWLERRIDPFAPFDEGEMPPASVRALRLVLPRGRCGSGSWCCSSSRSPSACSRPRSTSSSAGSSTSWRSRRPERLFAEHGTAASRSSPSLILFVRPLLHFAHEAIINQILVPQTTNMIRWRTHLYTLGHSLELFPGATSPGGSPTASRRPARRIREHGGRRSSTRFSTSRSSRSRRSALFSIDQPVARAADGAVDRRLYRAAALFRAAGAGSARSRNAEARSVTVGRIVDSYTNILTVKLFARAEEERSAVRDALGALHAALPQLASA